jgi:uncharacterized membrane protein YccC
MTTPRLYEGLFAGTTIGYMLARGFTWTHLGAALLTAAFVLVGWLLCDICGHLGRATYRRIRHRNA